MSRPKSAERGALPAAYMDERSSQAVLAVYSAVSARRDSFDDRMWQVPALAMTAQAFLMAIALGSTGIRAPKFVAAVLGLVLAVLSMQLMAKHRFIELLDNRLLEKVERDLGLEAILGELPHAALRQRAATLAAPRLVRLSSYRIWMAALGLFGLADIAGVFLALA